jgi:hypothetical protein
LSLVAGTGLGCLAGGACAVWCWGVLGLLCSGTAMLPCRAMRASWWCHSGRSTTFTDARAMIATQAFKLHKADANRVTRFTLPGHRIRWTKLSYSAAGGALQIIESHRIRWTVGRVHVGVGLGLATTTLSQGRVACSFQLALRIAWGSAAQGRSRGCGCGFSHCKRPTRQHHAVFTAVQIRSP